MRISDWSSDVCSSDLLIWHATPECHPCFGPIVRLLILTGQRREEVCGMHWQELDRAERLWTLPGRRTQNSEFNTIPLNELAMIELGRLAGGEKWPRKGSEFARSGEQTSELPSLMR